MGVLKIRGRLSLEGQSLIERKSQILNSARRERAEDYRTDADVGSYPLFVLQIGIFTVYDPFRLIDGS